MDIEKIREEKYKLECKIKLSVADLVEKFKVNTGLSPEAIDIYMVSITNMGEIQRYVVGRCTVNITI